MRRARHKRTKSGGYDAGMLLATSAGHSCVRSCRGEQFILRFPPVSCGCRHGGFFCARRRLFRPSKTLALHFLTIPAKQEDAGRSRNKTSIHARATDNCFRLCMIGAIRLMQRTTHSEILPPLLAEDHQTSERMLHISTGFLLRFGEALPNQGLKARAWDLLWPEAV